MANFDTAFAWLMESVSDEFGGVDSYAFPTAFRRIAALPPMARKAEIYNFYLSYFWNPGQFDRLNSDDLAKRVFDAAVQLGSTEAIKLLQSSVWPPLEQDGIWSLEIITAANGAFPEDVIRLFKTHRLKYYLENLNGNPAEEKWIMRAER